MSYFPSTQKGNLGAAKADQHGKIKKETVALQGVSVTRVTFDVGAKWSNDLKDYAGTDSCQLPHVALVLSGTPRVVMDDGSQQLGQRGDPVIETDFLDYLAVPELEDGDAGEVHLPARVGGQAAGEEILEGRAGMGAATFPLADDVVALGDEVGRAPEVQIGERGAEIGHEGLDVFATFAGLMQRVFQQHVRRGNVVDHTQMADLAPKVSEPTADNGLVVILHAHGSASGFVASRVTG